MLSIAKYNFLRGKRYTKQESVPVGCVPPTFRPLYFRSHVPGSVGGGEYLPWGPNVCGGGEYPPLRSHVQGYEYPLTRHTHALDIPNPLDIYLDIPPPPWTYLPLEGTWYQRYRPVDRHTPVKTWPSSNFVGMRQLSETFKWAFKWIILNGSCDKFVLSQIIFCN